MNEQAILFGNQRSLVGVLTHPSDHTRSTPGVGVLLLNAGIVHRVGPGRIYVKIARELAARGFTVVRFDFSGIGDSKSRCDDLPFDKSAVEEVQSAMGLLQADYGIRRFVLLGGCSGARVSLDTASLDARVSGAILINFPSPDEAELETDAVMRKNSHYVRNFAIRSGQSWRRFFTGQADYKKLASTLLFEIRRRVTGEPMALHQGASFRASVEPLLGRGMHPVFVCSEGDSRLEDLRRLGGTFFKRMCRERKIDLTVVPRSDHTFSSLVDHERLIDIINQKTVIAARSGAEHLASFGPAIVPDVPVELSKGEYT